jgi:hypothetical protein
MHKTALIFLFILTYTITNGQVFLQLNRYANPEAKRFYESEKFTFKSTEFPDDWFTKKIDRFMISDSLILFDEGSVPVQEITDIKIFKPVAKTVGNKLIQFGMLWIAYGAIIYAYDSDTNPFGWREAGIGLGSIGTGWLTKKLFYTKSYNINQKNRLKIMDLSF